jgi:hypothetical protein
MKIMDEGVSSIPVEKQINSLRKEQDDKGFDPTRFKRIILLTAEQYENEGKDDGRISAYKEGIEEIEKDKEEGIPTPDKRAVRNELFYSVLELERGNEDPIQQIVHGVQVSLLTFEKAKSLRFDDPQKYLDIAQAVEDRIGLFGRYKDWTNAQLELEKMAQNALE